MTNYANSGSNSRELNSIEDGSNFDLPGESTAYTSSDPHAKNISFSNTSSITRAGADTTTGALLNTGDTLIFIMRRDVDPQVNTMIIGYRSGVDDTIFQYNIVGDSIIQVTILDEFDVEQFYTVIPDTNFMLAQWNFVAIVFDPPNGISCYINGIRRTTFSLASMNIGENGSFKVGGSFNPNLTSVDVKMDDICIVGGVVSEENLTNAYSVWKSGVESSAEVSVGESSASDAYNNQYSTYENGGLATRTVITSSEFLGYELEFGSDTATEIKINEGTNMNLYIYGGADLGSLSLQLTELNIDSVTNNSIPYTFTTAVIYLVFESISGNQAIQFSSTSIGPPPISATVKINCMQFFGAEPANTFGFWNNFVSNPLNNLVSFDTGLSVGWSISKVGTPGRGSQGVDAIGTGDAAWVDEAIISKHYHFAQQSDGIVLYTLSGLDNTKTYQIQIFASREDVGVDTGEYSVDDFVSFESLDASENSTTVVDFPSVSPNLSNQIEIKWRALPGVDVGYMNAILINELS